MNSFNLIFVKGTNPKIIIDYSIFLLEKHINVYIVFTNVSFALHETHSMAT